MKGCTFSETNDKREVCDEIDALVHALPKSKKQKLVDVSDIRVFREKLGHRAQLSSCSPLLGCPRAGHRIIEKIRSRFPAERISPYCKVTVFSP